MENYWDLSSCYQYALMNSQCLESVNTSGVFYTVGQELDIIGVNNVKTTQTNHRLYVLQV